MTYRADFVDELKREMSRLVAAEQEKFSDEDSVRVDIHCHDLNSDVPDERMARILRWPETWVKTEDLLACLERNGAVPLTVTNHNNARSCFELMDRGMDILPGAEFTCSYADFDLRLHVLTYGFTPAEEVELNRRRRDLYAFLDYARDRDLVTSLAHPLFFYKEKSLPPFRYLERLMLLFDNIEVWNGQRDAWQNILMARYIESLDEEKISALAAQENISPGTFCRRPFEKRITGGSDCHMAMFAGTSGTRFHVPSAVRRTAQKPLSRLVLDAFKQGDFAWYGTFTAETKLTAALLDYFCQAVRHIEDPGLLRLLLHKGEAVEKATALGVLNGVMELRRHKYTSRFISTFHKALHGKRPGFMVRRMTRSEYRPFLAELDKIAAAHGMGAAAYTAALEGSIPEILRGLLNVLSDKVEKNLTGNRSAALLGAGDVKSFLEDLECPAALRDLWASAGGDADSGKTGAVGLLDGLPFPALAAGFLGAAVFSGAAAMYNNREILDEAARRVGAFVHPKRALWLTDTFRDRNGVSTSLKLLLDEIRRRELPIDLAVVSDELQSGDHLVVLPSVLTLTSNLYRGQPIRFADITSLHRLLSEKRYDRIVCSTEGPMGVCALYLQAAFHVPAYFYMHTDWIDFAVRTLGFEQQSTDRLRRLLRAYYSKFEGVFVLNEEHANFLAGPQMGIPKARIHKTAHWAKSVFRPQPTAKNQLFPGAGADTPVVLYAGRVSDEKGIAELPWILNEVRKTVPGALLAVAGDGPALDRLKREIPDGRYFGWVSEDLLSKMYAAADVMIMPSKFDTFGNVVLEAHACGLPVVAYNTKGPRDIILSGKTGHLVDTVARAAEATARLLSDERQRRAFSAAALVRASEFSAEDIVSEMLAVLGLSGVSSTAPFRTGRATVAASR